jgi:hypothetical protein
MQSDDWRDHAWPVEEARQAFLKSGSDADRARYDAARRVYDSRRDCSVCPRPGLCHCTFDFSGEVGSPPAHVHSDAGDHMPKSFSTHLKDCGGDVHEASRRFHAETMPSRRPTAVPSSLRSDAIDDAERDLRLRNATAWCTTDEQRKQVQHRLAEQADRDAQRKRHLASVRTAPHADAADDPVSMAEAAQRKRSANAWRKPLQASKPGWGGNGDAA